jgi:hypothetical protein
MPLLSFSHEIESKLYPDYDDGLFQRMYIGLEEKILQGFRTTIKYG